MKKVFLFAIAIVAISFASCSNKGNADSSVATDSVPTVAIEEVEAIIPDSVDSSAIIVDEIAVETPIK